MNLISVILKTLKNLASKESLRAISTVEKADPIHDTPKLRNEIIMKLCKYIDHQITLKDFADWFVPLAWNLSPKDTAVNKLVYEIKLRFAEHSNGHWTKEELREKLIDLIV